MSEARWSASPPRAAADERGELVLTASVSRLRHPHLRATRRANTAHAFVMRPEPQLYEPLAARARARARQRGDRLLARHRRAERGQRELRGPDHRRALADALQFSGSRRKKRGRLILRPWPPPGHGRPRLVRIPAARTATTAPTPQMKSESAARGPERQRGAGDHGGDRGGREAEPVGREHEPDQRMLAAAQHERREHGRRGQQHGDRGSAGGRRARAGRRAASGSISASAITQATSAAGTRKRPRSVA